MTFSQNLITNLPLGSSESWRSRIWGWWSSKSPPQMCPQTSQHQCSYVTRLEGSPEKLTLQSPDSRWASTQVRGGRGQHKPVAPPWCHPGGTVGLEAQLPAVGCWPSMQKGTQPLCLHQSHRNACDSGRDYFTAANPVMYLSLPQPCHFSPGKHSWQCKQVISRQVGKKAGRSWLRAELGGLSASTPSSTQHGPCPRAVYEVGDTSVTPIQKK